MDYIKLMITNFNLSDFNGHPSITIIDIIDILLVAYIVYKIIFWVKETRAWILCKGILVIGIFTLIAYILKLNTILWILSNTISVGILALIVVFQPELRKALEKLGKSQFLFSFFSFDILQKDDGKSEAKTIDEVLKAVDKMAAVKTGALILLENDVPLGDHERTGIEIDSVVSSQLLINIFEHNTPLHDGAVIIRNNRIAAATCFLPISENGDISLELGTRHRAGIGVSEVSDADVIIVSEETGAISLANGGILYRNITIDTLRSMLMHKVSPPKKRLNIWKGRNSDENN